MEASTPFESLVTENVMEDVLGGTSVFVLLEQDMAPRQDSVIETVDPALPEEEDEASDTTSNPPVIDVTSQDGAASDCANVFGDLLCRVQNTFLHFEIAPTLTLLRVRSIPASCRRAV